MELQDEKAIIERYRNSDIDARLCLFLDNRSLRAEFSAIDLADVERHLETTTGERPAGFLMNRIWDSAKRILPRFPFTENHRQHALNRSAVHNGGLDHEWHESAPQKK